MAFDRTATEAAAKEEKAAAAAQSKAQMMNLVRTGGVLLIVLVALFLAWRSAKKAGVTRLPVPGVLSAGPVTADALHAALTAIGAGPTAGPTSGAVGSATNVDALEPGERFPNPALPSASPAVNDELAELIERQPDEVASILRGWLADRRS
jgi:flagellar M-ring protein FliF